MGKYNDARMIKIKGNGKKKHNIKENSNGKKKFLEYLRKLRDGFLCKLCYNKRKRGLEPKNPVLFQVPELQR